MPTGNFGDIFAGYAAKRIGLPIEKLVIATNSNDILARTLSTGRYELRKVKATASPSMDIQVSSNFERLLFEACGRDSGTVNRLMAELSTNAAFTIEGGVLDVIRTDFVAGRADEAETAATIRGTFRETGFLPDPHTAVGLAVARNFAEPTVPMVTLATAHPAKFPESVVKASGQHPALPEGFGGLMERNEEFAVLHNDRGAVEEFILARARAIVEKV